MVKKILLLIAVAMSLSVQSYAATLYLKAAGGNFSAAGTWSNVNAAGGDNSGPPTAADNVVAELASGNLTIDGTSGSPNVCRSFDTTSGTGSWGGTLTAGSTAFINIGDGTAGTGNVAIKLNSGITFTANAASTFRFITTSATQQTIDFGGKSIGNITTSASGSDLAVTTGITSTGTLTTGAGTFRLDGASDNSGLTHTLTTVSPGGTGTFKLGTSTINVSGSWNFNSLNSNFNAGTSSITFSSATPTTAFNTLTYYDVTFSGATTVSLNTTNSSQAVIFHNLVITGSAVKTAAVSLPNPITVTNQFTVNGNSSTNRLLFGTSSLGTARTVTLTGATVSTNNIDVRDVTFARTTAGGLDLTNGGANLIGDCGGNTRTGGDGTVTFTTGATQTYTLTGVNDNWDTTAKWSSSRIPLPQDTVVLDIQASRTLNTNGVLRLGKDISFATAGTLNQNNGATTSYGSLNLTNMAAMSASSSHTLEGRGSHTITSAGKTMPWTLNISSIGGTYTAADAMTLTGGSGLTLNNGTFNDGGFNHSFTVFSSSNSSTRALTRSGNWSITATGTSYTTATSSNMTLTDTGTVTITDTSSSSKTFAGGSLIYNNLTITGSGSGAVIISGSNTFNTITINNPKTLTLTAGTTQTITSLIANGASGNVITINSSSGGSAATISDSSGQNVCNYCSIQDSTVSGGAGFVATNSTSVSGNTGWLFQKKVVVNN